MLVRRFPSRLGRFSRRVGRGVASARRVKRSGKGSNAVTRKSVMRLNPGVSKANIRNWVMGMGAYGRLSNGRGITFASDYVQASLKAVNSYTLTGGTAGVMGESYICLNDIAHPWNGTGRNMVDHDPYGLVQWRALYNRYRVHACTVEMHIIAGQSTYDVAAWLPCRSDDSYSMSGQLPLDPMERDAGWVLLTDELSNSNANTAGPGHKYAQTYWIHQIEGLTRQAYDADTVNYVADTSSSPGKRVLFKFGVGNHYGNNSSGCTFVFNITYHLTFYDKKAPGHS